MAVLASLIDGEAWKAVRFTHNNWSHPPNGLSLILRCHPEASNREILDISCRMRLTGAAESCLDEKDTPPFDHGTITTTPFTTAMCHHLRLYRQRENVAHSKLKEPQSIRIQHLGPGFLSDTQGEWAARKQLQGAVHGKSEGVNSAKYNHLDINA